MAERSPFANAPATTALRRMASMVLLSSPPGIRAVLTTFDLDEYVFGALRAGASGFLLKDAAPEALIAAVHTIASGEVLLLMVTGSSDREIATRLFISEATVKTHVLAVLRKLGIRDRIQAVIFGYESGLVTPGR